MYPLIKLYLFVLKDALSSQLEVVLIDVLDVDGVELVSGEASFEVLGVF